MWFAHFQISVPLVPSTLAWVSKLWSLGQIQPTTCLYSALELRIVFTFFFFFFLLVPGIEIKTLHLQSRWHHSAKSSAQSLHFLVVEKKSKGHL